MMPSASGVWILFKKRRARCVYKLLDIARVHRFGGLTERLSRPWLKKAQRAPKRASRIRQLGVVRNLDLAARIHGAKGEKASD